MARARAWPALGLSVAVCATLIVPAQAQERRKVYIDQDSSGPGGTNMQAIRAVLNSPATDVLGIRVLTGDQWRDEEVQHTLRLLEIVGSTEIPVLPGAAFPLVSCKEYIAKWETLYGKIIYQGAWNYRHAGACTGRTRFRPCPKARRPPRRRGTGREFHGPHGPKVSAPVTIYAAGPMTDLALAIALDPRFPELAKELIVMGGKTGTIQAEGPRVQSHPAPRI